MKLIDKLPFFYDNDITRPIQNGFNVEVDIVNEEILNTLDQFFIDSSTHGLDSWENMLHIKKNNLDIQTRRENIKAKIRTRGASTLSSIKNICESYSNGEVDIIVDNANCSFIVKFVGTLGLPTGLSEIEKVINDIKPCHLAHSFEFIYNTYKELNSYTYEQLKVHTYKELKEGVL